MWRQGRSETALIAGVLVALAALLLVTGAHMHSVFHAMGLSACTTDAQNLPTSCALQAQSFLQRFDGLNQLGPWLGLVGGLIGALLAMPVVLEFDQGTYRLAWTQSITPRRWLTTRVGLMLLGALLSGVVIVALATYWRHPLDSLGGHVGPNEFDLEGILPIAYTLFAATAVLAIGTVTRRTGLAVAAGFGVWLLVRLLLRTAREHLIPPLHTLTHPPLGPSGIRHAWVISQSYTGPHGSNGAYGVIRSCFGPDGELDKHCLAHRHIFSSWVYEPASRFWPLQGAEAGIFFALSLACLGLAVWWIRHRIA
jgi:hypothetical protein